MCYLIGGCIQVGQGNIEQIVLQSVDPCRNGQLQGLGRSVHNLLPQQLFHCLHTEIWTEGVLFVIELRDSPCKEQEKHCTATLPCIRSTESALCEIWSPSLLLLTTLHENQQGAGEDLEHLGRHHGRRGQVAGAVLFQGARVAHGEHQRGGLQHQHPERYVLQLVCV